MHVNLTVLEVAHAALHEVPTGYVLSYPVRTQCHVILSFFILTVCFCYWLWVFLPPWSHSGLNVVIMCTKNKPIIHTYAHAWTRKPITWTNGEIFEIASVWNRKETTGNCAEFMQSWGGSRHKCTAITTQADPTVVSIQTTTASLPRQIGHRPSVTTLP